ncbi:MAG: class I SAM-dependent methyltransferase [Ignavibacteriales bacterium]|nr:class I SAM-dependent methyltransferase [Ignavibacteriales bacterium]MCB9218893.1 class I SAM-dependent methyltransferase [Ignavibacteriales bacterium]
MKEVNPYTHFSKIYAHLMKSVDYSFWAKYIKEIHSILGNTTDIALELAAGNGKLSKYLKKQFSELYISDYSISMLKLKKKNQTAVCCNMLNLPFKIEFDFIFSAFDSINYIDNENKLIELFKEINQVLSSDGIFTFDVSLLENSIKHLKKLNRSGIYKGIKYNQISELNKKTRIHKNSVEIILPNGEVYKEIHNQKIYDFYYYFEAVELAGLYIVECFDAFSFEDGNPDSERIQFIVRRKN